MKAECDLAWPHLGPCTLAAQACHSPAQVDVHNWPQKWHSHWLWGEEQVLTSKSVRVCGTHRQQGLTGPTLASWSSRAWSYAWGYILPLPQLVWKGGSMLYHINNNRQWWLPALFNLFSFQTHDAPLCKPSACLAKNSRHIQDSEETEPWSPGTERLGKLTCRMALCINFYLINSTLRGSQCSIILLTPHSAIKSLSPDLTLAHWHLHSPNTDCY